MMCPAPAAPSLPCGFRLAALRLATLCLLVVGAAPVAAVEFGAPTILRPPFPEDFEGTASFGGRVAIDRGTLAVQATSVRGGTIYIYQRLRGEPGQWRLAEVLDDRSLPGRVGPGFDGPLALEGDTLVVGAHERVYLFRRTRRGWLFHRVLDPKLRDSDFGAAVAISGQRIAVGAPGKNRVLIYERNASGTNRWGLTATLQGRVDSPALAACLDAGRPVPGFGASVSFSGKTLVVGSWDFDNPALPGKVARNTGTYLFEPDPASATGWRQLIDVSPPLACDDFDAPDVYLDGPDLLIDFGGVARRWALHERNLGGNGRWGRRTRRTAPEELSQTYAALRGNLLAIGDRHRDAAWVYARDTPARNRWGLAARLSADAVPQLPCCPGGKTTLVAIGPQEVVTGHPLEDAVQIFPLAPIQADDFESGDTRAWPGRRGRVEVVSPGLGSSDAALAVSLGGGPQGSFVASHRPRRQPRVSISFKLLANQVDLARQAVEILRLYAGKPVLRVLLEENPVYANYLVRLQVWTRGEVWFEVGAVEIPSDEERTIGVEYGASTATGAADGRARIDADGMGVRQARNLDLERRLVTRVVLGLPVGSPPEAGGAFLIDDFTMHR